MIGQLRALFRNVCRLLRFGRAQSQRSFLHPADLDEGSREAPVFPADFDEAAYLLSNPDLMAAGLTNARSHWRLHGKIEGRRGWARVASSELPPTFSEKAYLHLNSDVAHDVANGIFLSGASHWLRRGRFEGRKCSAEEGLRLLDLDENQKPVLKRLPSPNAFDAITYAKANPDIANSLGRNHDRLNAHWRSTGILEARPWFGLTPYARRARTSSIWLKQPSICCYGFFDSPSGLGTAARSYRDAIIYAGFKVDTVTCTESNGLFETKPETRAGDGEHAPGCDGRINIFFLNADMVHRFFIDGREHLLDDRFNVAVWHWELAHFRPEWTSVFGAFDEIWVSSEFCRRSVASLSPVPVQLVKPFVEGIESHAHFSRKHFRLPDEAFVFGCVFDVGSTVARKNPQAVIRAFRSSFEGRDDTILVLKYHGVHHYPETIKELHELAAGATNIRFFGSVMTDSEILSLKAAMDCLISAHRSEGFGFNLTEAMLLDKPVIATLYSGNVDFMSDETTSAIAFKLCEVGADIGPYPARALWANPDIDDLARQMRHVAAYRAEALSHAQQARQMLLSGYNRQACARRIKAHIDDLNLLGTLPRPLPHWGPGVQATYVIQPEDNDLRISLVIPILDASADLLVECVNSILVQSLESWELILFDGGSTDTTTVAVLLGLRGLDPRIKICMGHAVAGNAAAAWAALEYSCADFVAFLDPCDALAPNALQKLCGSVELRNKVDILFTDAELKGATDDRVCNTTTAWALRLESCMYLPALIAVRRSLLLQVDGPRGSFGGAQPYDLALRLSGIAEDILCIPQILRERMPGAPPRWTEANDAASLQNGRRALEEHLVASGRTAIVDDGTVAGTYRVRDLLPAGLTVTVLLIAENRNELVPGWGQINLFDSLFNSVTRVTQTKCLSQILVLDSGDLSAEQKAGVEKVGGAVATCDVSEGHGSLSRQLNFGLKQVETNFVVLIKDCIGVSRPDWLDSLLELAIRPGIGVVGAAPLRGPVGGTAWREAPEHANGIGRSAPEYGPDAPRPGASNHSICTTAAVGGACLAMRMALVDEIGGFDETFLAGFQDLDFSLRAGSFGYRNCYTPYAAVDYWKRPVTTQDDLAHDLGVLRRRWPDAPAISSP